MIMLKVILIMINIIRLCYIGTEWGSNEIYHGDDDNDGDGGDELAASMILWCWM